MQLLLQAAATYRSSASTTTTIHPRRSRSCSAPRPVFVGRRAPRSRCTRRRSRTPATRGRGDTARGRRCRSTGRFASGTGNPRSTTRHSNQLSGGDSARPVARSTSRRPIRVPRGPDDRSAVPEGGDGTPVGPSLLGRANAWSSTASACQGGSVQARSAEFRSRLSTGRPPRSSRSSSNEVPLWTTMPGRRACGVSYGRTRCTGVGGTAVSPCRNAADGPVTSGPVPIASRAAATIVNGSAAAVRVDQHAAPRR